jgi:hypothetical protein
MVRNYIVELPPGGPAVIEEPVLIAKLGVIDVSSKPRTKARPTRIKWWSFLLRMIRVRRRTTPDHQSLSEIRTIGGVGPLLGGELKVLCELPGPITVGTSVSRFEVVVGLRNLNTADLPNFSA